MPLQFETHLKKVSERLKFSYTLNAHDCDYPADSLAQFNTAHLLYPQSNFRVYIICNASAFCRHRCFSNLYHVSVSRQDFVSNIKLNSLAALYILSDAITAKTVFLLITPSLVSRLLSLLFNSPECI